MKWLKDPNPYMFDGYIPRLIVENHKLLFETCELFCEAGCFRIVSMLIDDNLESSGFKDFLVMRAPQTRHRQLTMCASLFIKIFDVAINIASCIGFDVEETLL